MTKLSTRWTNNPDSYAYHMLNKAKIVKAMADVVTGGGIGFKELAGIIINKNWIEPEETDFPNYQFVYNLAKTYIDYSKSLEVPLAESIVYENFVKYIASLAKQDPAYYTRFNGVLFRVLHDYTRGKISNVPGKNSDYLKFIVNWWDIFDGRERNHELYKRFLDHIVEKYATEKFYQNSIDFCLNWIGMRQADFIYSDDMNPKKWYGNCGVGLVDNLTMGGNG